MNLLKTLFSSEMEATDFFEPINPLTTHIFNSAIAGGYELSEFTAVVKTEITPGHLGRVRFQGVRWRACCDRPFVIPVGFEVRVVGRRANILVVEPVEACLLS
jgi:membrane-bound ClpP family serine protease